MKPTLASTQKSQLSVRFPTLHGSSVGVREEEEEEEVENGEECGLKKRRLSLEQVKELERSFEEQNRLEPEMKVKLAKELGLQPRQIAIWFQNRRARWKTKKLERGYQQLRVDYEALKLHFQDLQQDREKLLAELSLLRRKVSDGSSRGTSASFGEGNLMNSTAKGHELSSVVISGLGDLRDGSERDSIGNDNSPNRSITDSDQYGSPLLLGNSVEKSDFAVQITPGNKISGNGLSRSEEEHGFVSPDGSTLNFYGEEQTHAFPWFWFEL